MSVRNVAKQKIKFGSFLFVVLIMALKDCHIHLVVTESKHFNTLTQYFTKYFTQCEEVGGEEEWND